MNHYHSDSEKLKYKAKKKKNAKTQAMMRRIEMKAAFNSTDTSAICTKAK